MSGVLLICNLQLICNITINWWYRNPFAISQLIGGIAIHLINPQYRSEFTILQFASQLICLHTEH